MSTTELPSSITNLLDHLQLVEFEWHGQCIQIPKFAVYAILDNPVFDRYMYREDRKMGIIQMDRYHIPVLDPFLKDMESEPPAVVVISHCKDNRFGLFGYPADIVRDDVQLTIRHKAVNHIVRAFC